MTIKRAVVAIGSREVQVRYAGSGPAVVLVHQSPTSARTLDLQTASLANAGFTAVAIDIPGLGQSGPLPLPQPEIEDQAEALAAFMDQVGIERAGLYGSHTGGLICVEFARRYPERAAVTLVDGYPIYTPDERARRVATYFPPFELAWDGSHLLWLWYRYREQYLFWPWNIPSAVTRANCDVPDPAYLQAAVVDLLQSGNDYRKAYAAAFRCESEKLFEGLTAPVRLLAYPDDSLTRALELVGTLPQSVTIEQMPLDRQAGVEKEIALFRAHPGAAPAALRFDSHRRFYADADGRQLAMLRLGPASGRPLVMVAPAPGGFTMIQGLGETLAADRPVLMVDAPWCGDSDPGQGAPGIAGMAAGIAAALKGLGIDGYDLYGRHGGGAVAEALTGRRLVLDGVASLPADQIARYAPPIEPKWDGTQLISLWHAVRSKRLFKPWFDQRMAASRRIDGGLEPEALTVEVLAYLRSAAWYDKVFAAVLGSPATGRSGKPTLPTATRDDEFLAETETLSGFVSLPGAVSDKAAVIRRFLDAS